MKRNILFIVPYPIGKAPSQRFRFEQYFGLLSKEGVSFSVAPFLDLHTWDILYKPGLAFRKALGIIKGFLKRIWLLTQVGKFDFIFIHREATPIGPPWFEWVVGKVLKKKIIYDFDDAIWIPNTSEANKIVSSLKWHQKVESICKLSYKVSCGNGYLASYASNYNSNVVVNPTTIDTINLHNQVKNQNSEKVVIGWTGTHSTMKYLNSIIPVLERLEKEFDFTFHVISNARPEFSLSSLKYTPWSKETEIKDLLQFNVGIMPLEDDPWAKGKCAFKALQYMALGIPAVVSPVGMNNEVVNHGVNGYICDQHGEWYRALAEMIQDSEKRTQFGMLARVRIEEDYAVAANGTNFLGLFK